MPRIIDGHSGINRDGGSAQKAHEEKQAVAVLAQFYVNAQHTDLAYDYAAETLLHWNREPPRPSCRTHRMRIRGR